MLAHPLRPAVVLPLAALLLGCPALAQTWDGGGADNNWTTPGNWNPNGAPANNGTANLIFAGTTRLTPFANVAPDLLSLTFSNTAGAFTLQGALAMTLRGSLTNNSAQAQTIQQPLILVGTQTWNLAAESLTTSGAITLNGALTVDGTHPWRIDAPTSGPGSLTRIGGGALNLNAPLTHTGGTTINAGTLVLLQGHLLPPFGTLTLGSAGTLFVNGMSDQLGTLASTSASSTVLLPAGSVLNLGAGGASFTFPGALSGIGTLGKIGGGLISLSGSSPDFSGIVILYGGALALPSSERLGHSSTIQLNGGVLLLAPGVTQSVRQLLVSGGASVPTTTATINMRTGCHFGEGSVGARIVGTGLVTKDIPGTMTLQNINTYTGGTTITSGTLVITSDANLGSPGPALSFIAGTLRVLQPTTLDRLVIIAGTATIDAQGDTTITSTSAVGGTLTKLGPGALIFQTSASSLLSLSINEGSLRLADGVSLGGQSVALNGPGTLDIGAATLNAGTLAFGSSSTLRLQLAGSAPDQLPHLNVSGNATLGGTLNVQLINNFHPTGGGSITLLTAGSRQQQFAHVSLPPGMTLQYTPTEVRLRLCSADFNADGLVNSQDFFDFLTAFFASAPSADFNHDATVNSQDFFDFLTAFFNGC